MASSVNLNVQLTVTCAQNAYTVAGGAIRELRLELQPYGFSGSISFDQVNNSDSGGKLVDKLLAPFQKEDVIAVELLVGAYHADAEASTTLPQMKIKGYVVARSIREREINTSASHVYVHRYSLSFVDPAAYFWRQHFPCRLWVDTKMIDVLTAASANLFTVESSAAELTAVSSQIFLGLHAEQQTSFYDFVVEYCSQRNLNFWWDYAQAKYRIEAAKDSSASAQAIRPEHVIEHELVLPAPGRAKPVCINYDHALAKSEAITESRACTPIEKNFLFSSAVSADFDRFVARKKAAPERQAGLPGISLEVRGFPCVPLVPGSIWKFPNSQGWSSGSLLGTDEYRITQMHLHLTSTSNCDEGVQEDHAGFSSELSLALEKKSDTTLRMPDYQAAPLTTDVHGVVVSTLGEQGEETWENYEDSNKALIYKIKIPAWENKVISAPFSPILPAGKLFFPCFREEPVLVRLSVHEAKIAGVLGFGAWNTATNETQGEGMHFGASDERGACIAHDDASQHSTLKIRGIEAKDETKITISQGVMILSVAKLD
jgi:hypothetical protein